MKRNLIIFGCLLAAIFAFVYAFAFDSKLDLNGDNVHYLNLAKNIAEGHGYTTLAVGEGFRPASHFPPAYSFVLSLFMMLDVESLVFFKVLNGLFLLASLCLIGYVVYRLTKNEWLGFAVAVLPVFSPQLQHFANIVMSEMSYLFFTVLCLFSLYKYDEKPKYRFWQSPWFFVAILAAMAAYYTRTVGASCLFAVLVFYAFRKEWWQVLASGVGFVLLQLPWSLRNAMYGIESRYLGTIMTVNPWRPEEGTISTVGEMWDKMLKNFDETVIKGFKEALFPFAQVDFGTTSSVPEIVGGFLLLAVVFFGAWSLKKIRWFLLAFLAANIGLFMLWHGGNGGRYVVPIYPIIYLCFYTGVFALLEFLFKKIAFKKFAKWIPLAFLLMIFLMLPTIKKQAEIAQTPYPPAYKNYFMMAECVNANKDFKGAVVCCRKPELFGYYAPNVYTTNYRYTSNSMELIADLLKKRVDYVVLEQLGYASTYNYLYPAIVDHAELFPVVVLQYGNPDTYLLYFDSEKARAKLKEDGWKYAK